MPHIAAGTWVAHLRRRRQQVVAGDLVVISDREELVNQVVGRR